MALGIFLYLFVPRNQTQPAMLPAPSNTAPSNQSIGDLVIGSPAAPATIVEYIDYKCPECATFHQETWPALKQNYVDTGKVKVIIRPYPVYGEDGAKAVYGSYCAAAQDTLDVYYETLFAYMWEQYFSKGDYDATVRSVLDTATMNDITKSIGMDSAAYTTCVDEITYNTDYQKALQAAADDDIKGTPTFIIHDQKVVGPQPYEVFKTLVELQL